MKSAIIERLGQAELLLPTLIAEGLDANERVKLAAQHTPSGGTPCEGTKGRTVRLSG